MSRTNTNTLAGKTYEEIHGKEKAFELRRIRSNSLFGKKRSVETRRILSEVASKRVGEKNPFFGKKHSIKTRLKISATRRKKYKNTQLVNKQVRKYLFVREWTKKVMERDKYTCQTCGIRNCKGLGKTVKLEAHHKKELHKLIGNMSFKEAIKLKELYDIENGITLCRKCHKKIHNWKIKE